MAWSLVDNQGNWHLTDGKQAVPVSAAEFAQIKVGNVADVQQLVDGKTAGAATDEDLDSIRAQTGGAPFKKPPKVKRKDDVPCSTNGHGDRPATENWKGKEVCGECYDNLAAKDEGIE